MSLIWEAPPADGPHLHAFVIGVGDYPHLRGGSNYTEGDNTFGLAQVTCPPHTARLVTEWLLNEYSNDDCPLGSVELLLSPAQDYKLLNSATKPVDGATMTNIKNAFKKWVKRCDCDKENIALMYFCGHGLLKTEQFLLTESFRPESLDPWDECINFAHMHVGMRKCKAETQVFFVDACRETTQDILEEIIPVGNSLISAGIRDHVRSSTAYSAAVDGKKAFGRKNQPTFFGQAVVNCLGGLACHNPNGTWVVDTYKLSESISRVMDVMFRDENVTLACQNNCSGPPANLHYPAKPCVLVRLSCSPKSANSQGTVTLKRGGDTVGPSRPLPFLEQVHPGEWKVEVSFNAGTGFARYRNKQMISPSVFERSIKV